MKIFKTLELSTQPEILKMKFNCIKNQMIKAPAKT